VVGFLREELVGAGFRGGGLGKPKGKQMMNIMGCQVSWMKYQ